jgi:putative addiction module component (TIGR02574 family)
MTKLERAIKALDELPADRREEIVDILLQIIAQDTGASTLTEEQWAEIDRRRAEGFEPADPDHFDKLLARLS